MNTEIKAAWVKALRSGDYEQGQHYLSYTDWGGQRRMCCLGVLCDLAVQQGVIPPPRVDHHGRDLYGVRYGSNISLPPEVMAWAGVESTEGDLPTTLHNSAGATCLSGLNDTGSTFDEIADVIEEHF